MQHCLRGNVDVLKQVKCPVCKARLFDTEEGASGPVYIKCSVCKKITKIKLERGTPPKTYRLTEN